jgi:hypothetical protein
MTAQRRRLHRQLTTRTGDGHFARPAKHLGGAASPNDKMPSRPLLQKLPFTGISGEPENCRVILFADFGLRLRLKMPKTIHSDGKRGIPGSIRLDSFESPEISTRRTEKFSGLFNPEAVIWMVVQESF